MSVFTGIILYLMIYWLVLFAVLPWGNHPPDDIVEGHAGSAPANPRIKQKFLITGLLAAIVWGIVFALVYFEVIDFYGIARQMTQEDYDE
jgi:predicted secreted protein